MGNFASIVLTLKKSVKNGNQESLLSLFDDVNRFKRMDILEDAQEGSNVKVILEELGEIELKLGDNMQKGQKKSIMTLFWYVERSKPIEIKKDAEAGSNILIKLLST
jgi:hypothetical protein